MGSNKVPDIFKIKIGSPIPQTRECSLVTAGGIPVQKSGHVLDGNGAQADNLFSFTSGIRILEITGRCTAVGDATTLSGFKFVLYDGTNTVDLTDVVDCSGIVVGSKVIKTAAAATALTYVKADQVRVSESSFNKPFVEPFVNAKAGASNYIQVVFTGDENTDVTMTFCVKYAPVYSDSSLEAV